LKDVLEIKDVVNKITLCMGCNHARIKIAVLEILCTLCLVHGQIGHRVAIEAMSYFKFVHREPVRFTHLVEILKYTDLKGEHESQAFEIKMNCLSFINCLINIPDKLADRTQIRSEFLRLGLQEIIDDIQIKLKVPEILAQVKVFQEDLKADEDEFAEKFQRKDVELDNPSHIFENLQEILESLTYLQRPFHAILKYLLGFPIDSDVGLKCWVLAEKLIQQIALQKDQINIGEATFALDDLLAAVEDRAELETLKEKYDLLEAKLEEEKNEHARTHKKKLKKLQNSKRNMKLNSKNKKRRKLIQLKLRN